MKKIDEVLDEMLFICIEPDTLDVYRAYFDRENVEILHVATPGDHSVMIGSNPDMLKRIAEDRAKIKANSQRYVLIPTYSSNMAYTDMLDFANLQEQELREKLLYELTLPRPFEKFSEIVEINAELRQQWQAHKQQQRRDFVKKWAKQNSITVFDKLLA